MLITWIDVARSLHIDPDEVTKNENNVWRIAGKPAPAAFLERLAQAIRAKDQLAGERLAQERLAKAQRTVSVADILNRAINERLYDGIGVRKKRRDIISKAVWNTILSLPKGSYCEGVFPFLYSLGWDENSTFYEFPRGRKRQYARALTLTFAELIAREEER